MALQVQLRRDLAATWTAANPTLAQGEVGCELDTNAAKIGNGVDAWNDLPYWPSVASVGITTVLDEGATLGGAPHHTINFQGLGVAASGFGGGVATVQIPGLTFRDEGSPVVNGPHRFVNFVGTGVNVTDEGSETVRVTIPGAAIGGAKTIKSMVGYPGGGWVTGFGVPVGNYCSKVTVKVTTPFNGAPSTLNIRYLPSAGIDLMLAAENDLSILGINVTQPYVVAPSDGRVSLSLALGAGCTQGSADVFIEYIEVVS